MMISYNKNTRMKLLYSAHLVLEEQETGRYLVVKDKYLLAGRNSIISEEGLELFANSSYRLAVITQDKNPFHLSNYDLNSYRLA